MTAFTNSCH